MSGSRPLVSRQKMTKMIPMMTKPLTSYAPTNCPLALTLLMGDDPQCLLQAQRWAAAGYQVSVVHTADALSCCTPFPDLVVVNLGPDQGQTLAAIQKIRQLFGHAGVLVVITQGHAQSKTLAFLAGADNCIHSPCEFAELQAMMASLSRRVMQTPPMG